MKETAGDSAGLGWIDVHSHFVEPRAAADRAGDYRSDHYLEDPAPNWTPEGAIRFMDARGISAQLLSHPRALDPQSARRSNDYAASVVTQDPSRFGFLANLPLGSPDDALAELRHAADELGTDGFLVVSNYRGTYLGSADHEPVWAELDRRAASVFLHPVKPAGFEEVACGRPGPVIEFPFDTTRSVLDAIYAQVFSRYPNFHLVVAHGGGLLPALSTRIARIGTQSWVPRDDEITESYLREQISRLYYDTAIAGDAVSLGPLLQVTGRDHLVFGTDFAPASTEVIDRTLAELTGSDLLSPEDLAAMRDTALRLFPSLRDRLARQPGPGAR